MSFQPSFPGFFAAREGARPVQTEMTLPAPQAPTARQLDYARLLARRSGVPLPEASLGDRAALSRWIDAQKSAAPQGRFSEYPSSKQVAFAERIARLKRSPVPPECFRDRMLMSRWIDGNKPR